MGTQVNIAYVFAFMGTVVQRCRGLAQTNSFIYSA